MGKDNLVEELLGLRKSLEKNKKKNVLEYQLVRIYLYVYVWRQRNNDIATMHFELISI